MTTHALPDGLALLRPGDSGYSVAAATRVGDGTPELVARPTTTAQVAGAVRLARETGLRLTVRAGGHSMAGLTTPADGLLLDLRRLDRIEVDPTTRRVRIGGGACWGEVARALQPHGLGLTAGDTAAVGVGGLTLGGGIGWMVRRYGLAVDHLVGAEIVTADGRVLQVSDEEHPELFWALRGGGGGLGVVTRFDFVAQMVSDVVFGTAVYAPDDPLGLLTEWRAFQRDADERLTTVLTLAPPMGGQPGAGLLSLCFTGSREEAAGVVDRLPTLGTMLAEEVAELPYAEILEEHGPPRGTAITMDNVLLPELTDDALAAMATLYLDAPMVLSVRALGGAFSRVPADATAMAHRSVEAMVVAMRFPSGPQAPAPSEVTGWDAVARHGSGCYVNFLSSAGAVSGRASYPEPTRRRLERVKATYDPENVFGTPG